MDKYINLFTDFGFKKVFGEEPNKDLLISFLNTLLPTQHQIAELDTIPAALQESIFEKLFHITELIAFKPQERDAYQASLKYYRDLKNVIDTAYDDGVNDGFEKGIEQGREEERAAAYRERLNTARNLKQLGISNEQIAQATGLPMVTITDL